MKKRIKTKLLIPIIIIVLALLFLTYALLFVKKGSVLPTSEEIILKGDFAKVNASIYRNWEIDSISERTEKFYLYKIGSDGWTVETLIANDYMWADIINVTPLDYYEIAYDFRHGLVPGNVTQYQRDFVDSVCCNYSQERLAECERTGEYPCRVCYEGSECTKMFIKYIVLKHVGEKVGKNASELTGPLSESIVDINVRVVTYDMASIGGIGGRPTEIFLFVDESGQVLTGFAPILYAD